MSRNPTSGMSPDRINDTYSKLFEEYAEGMYVYGMSMQFPGEECKDAIQDVFFNLYTDRGKLHDVTNIKAYLYRSLRNRLINMHNREKRLDRLDRDDNIPFGIEVSVADGIVTAEEQEQIAKRVSALLSQLTARQKEAVYLRFMQGMSYEEIAPLMDMNAASVRKLVYRGLEKLREKAADDSLPTLVYLAAIFFIRS